MTLTWQLISREPQQRQTPNHVEFYVFDLATFYQSLVSGMQTLSISSKLEKKAKFGFNLRVNISRIRTASVFISSVILCPSFSNLYLKCGASTRNSIEMLILRKKAKFEFSLTVNISSTTTATASKSCVILRL